MKISQIKYFIAVCKYSSTSKASQEMHVSQPSISNAIKELESEYGIDLFYRVNNRLILTSAGEQLRKDAEEILKKIEEADNHMKLLSNEKNVIRIGLPSVIGVSIFPPLMAKYKSQTPDAEYRLIEFDNLESLTLIDNGQLDLVFTTINDIDKQNLSFYILNSSPLYLWTNKNHILAQHNSVSIKDIGPEPLILLKEQTYQYKAVIEMFEKNGCTPNILHSSSNLSMIRNFISSALTSSIMVDSIIKRDRNIVAIPIQESYTIDIGLVWKRTSHLRKSVRDFINYIKNSNY